MSKSQLFSWGKMALIATVVLGVSQGWDMLRDVVEVSNTPAQQKIIKDRLDTFQQTTTQNFTILKEQVDEANTRLDQMKAQLDDMNSTLKNLNNVVKLKQ
jgi:TolA-binding protein